MIVYLYCNYNAFISYLYFINNSKNVYSYPIGINTSYQYINNIYLMF